VGGDFGGEPIAFLSFHRYTQLFHLFADSAETFDRKAKSASHPISALTFAKHQPEPKQRLEYVARLEPLPPFQRPNRVARESEWESFCGNRRMLY